MDSRPLLHGVHPISTGQAVTVGNFDGVHLGHQTILQNMAKTGLPTTVLTFEPLPREVFAGSEAPIRLSSLREKTGALLRAGAKNLVCARFNTALAQLSATDFVHHILVQRLQTRALFVGHDFRFGAGRQGDVDVLRREGKRWGFTVAEQAPVCLDGQRVSSTGIRQFLHDGALSQAAQWLGRPYAVCGRVRRGDQLGRVLGFPTANLPLSHRPLPLRGIFAGVLRCAQGQWLAAISIGLRPTVGGKHLVLEAHCLDASPDMYGTLVQVELHHKLHDELTYDGLDSLKEGIAADVRAVRDHFLHHPVALDQAWTIKAP